MNEHPLVTEKRLIHDWLDPNHRVLDLGCGRDGLLTKRLADRCGHLTAVDRRPANLPVDNITWITSDVNAWMEDLAQTEQFDFAQTRLLLQFLQREEALKLITNLAKHIMPGGRVYILTWSKQASNGFPSHWKSNGIIHPWTFFSCDELLTVFPDWKVIWKHELSRTENGRYTGLRHTFHNSAIIVKRPL